MPESYVAIYIYISTINLIFSFVIKCSFIYYFIDDENVLGLICRVADPDAKFGQWDHLPIFIFCDPGRGQALPKFT